MEKPPKRPSKPKSKIQRLLAAGFAATALFSSAPNTNAAEKNLDSKPQTIEQLLKKQEKEAHIVETESGRKLELKHLSQIDFEGLSDNEYRKKVYDFVFSGPTEINKMDQATKDRYYSIWNMYRESAPGFGVDDTYRQLKKEREIIQNNISQRQKELVKANRNKTTNDKDVITTSLTELKAQLLSVQDKIEKRRVLLANNYYAERLAIMQTVLVRTREGKAGRGFKTTLSENILQRAQYSWTGENKFPVVKEKDNSTEEINFRTLVTISEMYDIFIDGKTIEESNNLIVNEINSRVFHNQASHEELDTLRNIKFSQSTSLFKNGSISDFAEKIAGENTKSSLEQVMNKVMQADYSVVVIGEHIFSINRPQPVKKEDVKKKK